MPLAAEDTDEFLLDDGSAFQTCQPELRPLILLGGIVPVPYMFPVEAVAKFLLPGESDGECVRERVEDPDGLREEMPDIGYEEEQEAII